MPVFHLTITGEPLGEGAVHQIAATAAVHGLQFTPLGQKGEPLPADQIRIGDYVPLSDCLNPLRPEWWYTLDRARDMAFRHFWVMIGQNHNSMLVILSLMKQLGLRFADVTPEELLREDLKDKLELSDPIWNVLIATCITSVEFLRRWTPAELREIPDMTPDMVEGIEDALRKAGIAYLKA
ncbi:MAG TPA: hypothetical protein VLA88_03815 [Candidatus Saccharimonadales bacterium]|nr:hypothetical protein [Candidatus Saccharimonadales bacterium]